ncbi:hypothetical protein [Thaumasiovibrio subtropicus]|uniref:hypothetical protein n=1 Tax=Thaumasiovibrio subtropicus TaxID=1891207 RepID=UPI000B35BC83|nr:hypothetical protein [Thaumasiovibrio subtropicus]
MKFIPMIVIAALISFGVKANDAKLLELTGKVYYYAENDDFEAFGDVFTTLTEYTVKKYGPESKEYATSFYIGL